MEHANKQKKKPWWMLSAVGVFLLSSGKNILVLLKFGKFGGAVVSMAVTIGAYALLFPFGFAVGLVVMILIHELGHVVAAKQKGLPVTAPVFIPFMGALIMMKKHPRDAETEAYIALGGPVLGTVGALICLWFGLQWEIPLLIVIANIGFFLNLINLLPIHPLDGGRISAAVTRWLWLVGLIGGLIVIVYLKSILFFIIWAMFAWEMYQKYIKRKGKGKPYEAAYRFDVAVEDLVKRGLMIPGEEHRRELPFTTYSTLDGQQKIIVYWDGIRLHEAIAIPQQGLIKRVHVTAIEHQPEAEADKLVVSCRIQLETHESETYYEVPAVTRWKFGLAYASLALILIYLVYYTQGIPLLQVR